MIPPLLLDAAAPMLIGAFFLIPLLGVMIIGVGVFFLIRALKRKSGK